MSAEFGKNNAKLGEYEFVRELGRGASATVYLGKHLSKGTEHSVKVFHLASTEDSNFAHRIRRECRVLESLNHPNIVPVTEMVTQGNSTALVMEYIDGGNLEKFQSKLPYVLPEVSALIVIEILKGLQHAHERSIIHRDLKPENVLVGHDGRVLVTDFGLAKVQDASTAITQPNHVLGSADYMSPEQTVGELVGPSSDLFSVATILYFLTTGTRPFSRSTALGTLQAVREQPHEPAERRNPKISLPLSRILLKGLTKDPMRRFQSAQEFIDALQGYLNSIGLVPEVFVFSDWIRDPSGVTMDCLRLSSDRMGREAELAAKSGRWSECLEWLGQLSLKSPSSPVIARLTSQAKFTRQSHQRSIWVGISAIALLLLSILFFPGGANRLLRGRGGLPIASAPAGAGIATTPPSISEVAAVPKVEPKSEWKPVEKPKIASTSPKKKPVPTIQSTSEVRFNVADGVQVFWDGREMNPLLVHRESRMGEHELMLKRPGFGVIRKRIKVKANEPSIINAK